MAAKTDLWQTFGRLTAPLALDEVNADYSTTRQLANILQRDANVPFLVAHHRATTKHYQMASAQSPLNEAWFRKSLTAGNMIQSALGVGGPQPSEVARMSAAQRASVNSDREWLDVARAKLDSAAKQRDEAFAALR